MRHGLGFGNRRTSGRMSWNDIEQLRLRARELELTRERLSRLYFSQVEAGKARMERLHRLLEVVTQLNSTLELEELLDAIVRAVQAALGFRVVLLRVLDPESRVLRARAFAGLSLEARARLEADEVPLDTFLSWLSDEFRVGRSFFISHTHAFAEQLPKGIRSDLGPREPWEWHEDDVLLVPLYTKDGEIVAYLSVDDPVDRLVPSRETIELLEVFGNHVVVALENARLYHTLKEHTRRLEEANTRLGELTRLKANFLSAISHELRTPLASIRAYVDSLRAGTGAADPESLERSLEVMAEESVRLESLIDSVLSFSALESGAGPEPVRIDLGQLVTSCAGVLGEAARSKGVELVTENREEAFELEVDPDLIQQMVLQLGGNAIKFTPRGGRVTVALERAEGEVRLSVRDTGIGIAGEELGRIFDRFYQIEGGLSRRYGGTGLGLAICKSVAEWHGGHITVTSQPGQGSCFVVHLPLAARPRAEVLGPRHRRNDAAEKAIGHALEFAAEALGAETVILVTVQEDGQVVPRASVGMPIEQLRGLRLCAGEGVAGTVMECDESLATANAEQDLRFVGHRREPYRHGRLLAAPLRVGERLAGVLVAGLGEAEAGADPTAEDERLAVARRQLELLAGPCAAALGRVERQHGSEAEVQVLGETLRGVLVHLRRDRRHAPDRVRYAEAIGRRLDLDPRELARLGLAAIVQDVALSRPESTSPFDGEPPVSENQVLRDIAAAPPGRLAERIERELERDPAEPGRLEEEEEGFRRHPEVAVEILSPLECDGGVRQMILAHHEWMNGRGWPRGLSGKQIPVGARILAVVDAFEGLVHGRIDRPAIPVEEAVRELFRWSGERFDPTIVEAFLQVLVEEGRIDEQSAARLQAA